MEKHRELETNLELFRDLINKSNDAVFVNDPQTGLFIFVNDTACASLGYDRAELVNMSVIDIEATLPDDFSWFHHMQEVRQKSTLLMEGVHKRKDGTTFPVEINVSFVALGNRDYMIAVVRNITKRKKAEMILKKREKQLAESQRIAHVGSWEHNLKTGQVFWSDELFRLLGLDPKTDTADFTTFLGMLHPEDTPALQRAIDVTLKEKTPFSLVYRIILKDGAVRVIHARAELIRDDAGAPVILSGTAQDITERKLQEQALIESEAGYRTLFDSSTDGIFILDLNGNFIDANKTAYERLGYTREEFLSLNIRMLVHPGFASRVFERFQRTTERGASIFESAHLRKDGSMMPVEVNARLLEYKGKQVIFSVIRDITERKLAEKAKDALIRAISVSTDGIAITDENDRFIYVNDAHARIYGCAPDELIGKSWRDTVSPDWEAMIERELDKTLHDSAVGIWSAEAPAIRKDGTAVPVEVTATARWDETGNYLGHICILRDITERKMAVEKIRQNEQFIRKILDTVDEGFIVIDRDYRILTANTAYCSQAGLPCDEVIGRHCFEISHNAARPCYEEGEDCAVRNVFADGEPHTVLHKHRDHDGQVLYVESKGFPIKDASGNVTSVIETISNITEKHLLEEERLKTQKLESIGTLAGGIAHDFNNLLQGIFGYVSMAKMTLDRKEKSLAMLEQAEKALHQSVNLTTQLLTFSKGGKPVKRRVDLSRIIENSAKFTLSGSNSELRLNIAQDLWKVEADEGQVSQVIQNIVLNADQSMPMGGSITITAHDVAAKEPSLPPGLAIGNYVRVAIEDIGIGIPAQYIARIFDPYFTTKEKGSGLGLATSYSIIRNHGGLIDVKSVSGKGTTFFIYLPAAEAETEVSEPPAPVLTAGRKGRILVMDDEALIRDIVRELILALKHDVDLVEHGEAAIERYCTARDAGRPFDIVILDLTIRAGMGGIETIRRLREIDPAIRAIVSSGYSDDALGDFEKYGFKARLSKPFTLETLRDALNALLGM